MRVCRHIEGFRNRLDEGHFTDEKGGGSDLHHTDLALQEFPEPC